MSDFIIKSITVIDSNSKWNQRKADILIHEGIIKEIASEIINKDIPNYDFSSCYISPGWVAFGVDLPYIGNEHRDTVNSLEKTLQNGGFTDVVYFGNSNPVIESGLQVSQLCNFLTSNFVNRYILGAQSVGMQGKEMVEYWDLAKNGAIGFSDAEHPIQDLNFFMRSLEYIKMLNLPSVHIPKIESLLFGGKANDSAFISQLGIKPIIPIVETISVSQYVNINEYVNGNLHFSGLSLTESIQLVKKSKEKGFNISCDIPAYILMYLDNCLKDFDTNFKVYPPLRTIEQQGALTQAILNQEIDFISVFHSPRSIEEKHVEFAFALNGMQTASTAFSEMYRILCSQNNLAIENLIDLFCNNIRMRFNLPLIHIEEGGGAQLTIFNTNEKWNFQRQNLASKSVNDPGLGQEFIGRSVATIREGKILFNS